MTITGYSNAFVDLMLGWLKGLANWVLRLFNLAGRVSVSPLLWLSQNWLKLLIFFLALGIAIDIVVWMVRWRPYWVWFRKERVIVNDDRFFVNADMDKADDWEGDLATNWDEHDYVVASTVVRRQKDGRGRDRASESGGRRSADRPQSRTPGRRSNGTKVQRHVDGGSKQDAEDRQVSARHEGDKVERKRNKPEIFATQLKKRDVSDSYEDEVFNVSSLPVFDEYEADDRQRQKPRGRRRN